MNSAIANGIIVWLARRLDCPPIVAHAVLMLCLTILFGFANPDGFRFFDKAGASLIWFGVCIAVILVTWLTKGDYRSAWLKAAPWRMQG